MNSSDHHQDATASHCLNEAEVHFHKIDQPYICTISWLHGDYKSAKIQLERRLRLMAKKNPWLLGHIAFNYKQGTCDLTYTTQKVGDDGDLGKWLDVIPPPSSPISRQVPFSELSGILTDSGMLISNGPHEPLFKVTVIPCSECPEERFALLVQLSHVAGDGATYYKLFHMLCSTDDDDIVELITERIANSKKQQIEVLGEAEDGYFTSSAFTVNALRGIVAPIFRRRTLQFEYGWVDESKMKEIKEHSAREAGVPFVSTNDVLTSWFMTQSSAPIGLMAINWRGRLEGHTDLHAGNYENSIFYQKEDFATPGFIRQSLTNYRRVVTGGEQGDFPSWWQVATTSVSVVTNWSTFAKPIEVEGCTEDIHLPITMVKVFPTTFHALVIFRARAGKIGLVYAHRGGVNHLLDSAPFLE